MLLHEKSSRPWWACLEEGCEDRAYGRDVPPRSSLGGNCRRNNRPRICHTRFFSTHTTRQWLFYFGSKTITRYTLGASGSCMIPWRLAPYMLSSEPAYQLAQSMSEAWQRSFRLFAGRPVQVCGLACCPKELRATADVVACIFLS